MLLVFTSGDNTISGSSTKKRLPQGTGINLIFSHSPAKSLFPLKKTPNHCLYVHNFMLYMHISLHNNVFSWFTFQDKFKPPAISTQSPYELMHWNTNFFLTFIVKYKIKCLKRNFIGGSLSALKQCISACNINSSELRWI